MNRRAWLPARPTGTPISGRWRAPVPAADAPVEGRVARLADAVRDHVRPGMHLHFASTPSRSNAAIREVARAFFGGRPGFRLSSTGFHSMAHLLPMLGLADRLIACFFGDHYPAPRPNPLYTRLVEAGVTLEHWSLMSLVSALRAGAQGDSWAFNRSLAGTTIAAELAEQGAYHEMADPADPRRRIGLCAAIRPDITFVHAAAADDEGHVVLSAPTSEGMWSALAARHGVIVTVERIISRIWTREHPDRVVLPPHRVLAVCEEPFGAHPQPLYAGPLIGIGSYRDDFEHYDLWRMLTTDDDAFTQFVEPILSAADGRDAYVQLVGASRLEQLGAAPKRRKTGRTWTPIGGFPISSENRMLWRASTGVPTAVSEAPTPRTRVRPAPVSERPPSPPSPVEQLIIGGARRLAARARATDARVLIAGIGQAFFAARIAQIQLAAEGIELHVMVETGLYDVDCGPDGNGYPLSYENISRARRLTGVDDVLGVLGCGADNRCLAALGAAQIDRYGNLNSTRLRQQILVGSGGACDIAAGVEEVVVLTRLQPGRLVERIDYITSPGRAVRSVVTDRCVLARYGDDPDGMRWSLEGVVADAPDADLDDEIARVRRDCPWRFDLAPDLGFDAAITDDELGLLNTLDPDGTYRRRSG